MKIIYCHHALRDFGNPPTQEDGITSVGKKDAQIVARLLFDAKNKGMNIVAIYSSPFRRCMDTAKIINKKLQVEIIEDKRFNEFNKKTSVKDETWIELQNRVREAIKEIVFKYDENDVVVCITSGVNIAPFISLAYNLQSTEETPFIGVPSCSPIVFTINKNNFNKGEKL